MMMRGIVLEPWKPFKVVHRDSDSDGCAGHRRRRGTLGMVGARLSIRDVTRIRSAGAMIRVRFGRVKCASPSSPAPDDDDKKESGLEKKRRDVVEIGRLWRRFRSVAAPYWFSEDKQSARLRLLVVFALTLGTTGISVGFNFLGRDFYNSLANKDQQQFTKQLLYYLAAFAGGIPVFVLRDYAKDTLSLRWRSWMTKHYMERYLSNRAFYKIQSQSIIDNPDQRIVDDVSGFTATALSFSLAIFNSAVDLISFSNILYGIYPPLFLVLLLYSIGGTALSVFLGRGLVSLNFLQEKKEADFRYGLVRVRENAESIAFYGGEENELQLLIQRFNSAYENLMRLLISSRNLDFFTSGYRYLIQVLPAAVVAPMYFSGKIEFGVINQSVSAFNHILGDISLIVYQFQAISAFSAVIDRLGEFNDILESTSQQSPSSIARTSEVPQPNSNGPVLLKPLLNVNNLTLQTPTTKSTLIRDLSLTINDRDHLLVMGPSGSGKTSLLRAMAGLWNIGNGGISYGIDEGGVFFLPQKPYMALGTLRQQLLYPNWSVSLPASGALQFLETRVGTEKVGKPTDEEITNILKSVRLGFLVERFGLDGSEEWSSVLSLGEQQRLAFARLLLSKPKLVLLDESTSALDESNEEHLYRMIEAAGLTYVSVGHRRSLRGYHKRLLRITAAEHATDHRNWLMEDVDSQQFFNFTKGI